MPLRVNSVLGSIPIVDGGRAPTISLKSDPGRLAMAALPAAAITAGLFVLMNQLIHVEEIHLDAVPQRILGPIVFDADFISEPTLPDHLLPEQIEVITPPPPPKVQMTKGEVGLPPIMDVGQVPTRTPIGSLGSIMTSASPMIDRTPVPVRPPIPTYPRPMAAGNMEGECLVKFNLTARGNPFDVSAECTPSGFESEARRAVEKAEFLPRILEGRAIETRGLSYPLEFRLNEE